MNQNVLKRAERRGAGQSPFGPGSRGARLLEMANKKSKSVNTPSSPSASGTLNNSFTELNTSGGSASNVSNDITVDNTTIPSLSKFVLMSPRIESREEVKSPLPASPVLQEKVSVFI